MQQISDFSVKRINQHTVFGALFMSHALSLLIRQRDNRSSITVVCVSEWPVQSTATPQSNAIYVVVTRYYNSTQNQSST